MDGVYCNHDITMATPPVFMATLADQSLDTIHHREQQSIQNKNILASITCLMIRDWFSVSVTCLTIRDWFPVFM